jgi:hypothetical protein
MQKLKAVYLNFPGNRLHHYFFTVFLQHIEEAGEAVKEALAPYLPELKELMKKEGERIEWQNSSELTKRLAAIDRDIVRLVVSINALVRAGRHSLSPEVRKSGERVYYLIKHYGRIPRQSYLEQHASLDILLERFAGEYAPDVAILNLGALVQQLRETLQVFLAALEERTLEFVAKPKYTTLSVRRQLNALYQQMKQVVNANALAGAAAAEFVTFIQYMNPEIKLVNADVIPARRELHKPGCTSVLVPPGQVATGEPVTPLLTVRFRNDVKKAFRKLVLGRDYLATYRNNVKPGTATAIVHGKGKYKGRFSVTFTIAPAPDDGRAHG